MIHFFIFLFQLFFFTTEPTIEEEEKRGGGREEGATEGVYYLIAYLHFPCSLSIFDARKHL